MSWIRRLLGKRGRSPRASFAERTERTVTLRDTTDADGTRSLTAWLDSDGDLKIEGRDYGAGVERIYGYREYEWKWTIRAADLDRMRAALDPEVGLLEALKKRFQGDVAAGLSSFLEANEVPYEAWSRIGD